MMALRSVSSSPASPAPAVVSGAAASASASSRCCSSRLQPMRDARATAQLQILHGAPPGRYATTSWQKASRPVTVRHSPQETTNQPGRGTTLGEATADRVAAEQAARPERRWARRRVAQPATTGTARGGNQDSSCRRCGIAEGDGVCCSNPELSSGAEDPPNLRNDWRPSSATQSWQTAGRRWPLLQRFVGMRTDTPAARASSLVRRPAGCCRACGAKRGGACRRWSILARVRPSARRAAAPCPTAAAAARRRTGPCICGRPAR